MDEINELSKFKPTDKITPSQFEEITKNKVIVYYNESNSNFPKYKFVGTEMKTKNVQINVVDMRKIEVKNRINISPQDEKDDKQKKVHKHHESGGGRYSASFKRCMKIMERMIRQNEEDRKYNDYRYYWQ